MSSKPPSQPPSSRGSGVFGAGATVGDDVDDALSEASDVSSDLLTKAQIRRGLSDVRRAADRKNYAFTRLDLSAQGIKSLEGDLISYPELQYLNISNNEVLDLAPLSVLPGLLSLNASQNHLHNLDLSSSHPNLQLLQLDYNDIEHVLSTGGSGGKGKGSASLAANFPSLFALTLSNNKLTSILRLEDSLADFTPHAGLTVLDLSFNNLSSLEGLSLLPSLRVLNLASNALERLEGIQELKQLEKLNVSENKLQSLFIELNRLATLPHLSALVITQGNSAFVDELEQAAALAATLHPDGVQLPVDMVSEILLILPQLVLLDGKKVNSAARRVADTIKKDRQADAERRAAEEEEARKLLAEEEAAEAKRRKEEEEEEEKDKEDEEKDSEEEEDKEDDEEENEKEDEEPDADAEADGDSPEDAEQSGDAEAAEADAAGGEDAPADDGAAADDGTGEDDGEPEEEEEEEEDE